MRALIQRVTRAGVRVGETSAAEIGPGLLVFLGVGKSDDDSDAKYLAEKIAVLRIFEDSGGKMNLSVQDIDGAVLVVSQFTLFADCRKGRRPSFVDAAEPERARQLYARVIEFLKNQGVRTAEGVFQASMRVELVNDGPVTILLDSKKQS
jgi:D-tyrosyl-tRNA(Tyr) deacylase